MWVRVLASFNYITYNKLFHLFEVYLLIWKKQLKIPNLVKIKWDDNHKAGLFKKKKWRKEKELNFQCSIVHSDKK